MSDSPAFRVVVRWPLAALRIWRGHRLLVVSAAAAAVGTCVALVIAVRAVRRRPALPDWRAGRTVRDGGASRPRRGSLSSASVLSIGSHHHNHHPTTALTLHTTDVTAELTSQQLGMLGVEALDAAIGHWQDAMSGAPDSLPARAWAVTSADEAAFTNRLQRILDAALGLRADCDQLFLLHDSTVPAYQTGGDCGASIATTAVSLGRTWTVISGSDSFHSATAGVADLSDFDDVFSSAMASPGGDDPQQEDLCEPPSRPLQSLALYQSAMQLHAEGGIPCRKLRTAAAGLTSDADFVARLHCVRLGFHHMLQQPERRVWMTDSGRRLLSDLMRCAGRPSSFIVDAYDSLTSYLAGTCTSRDEVWQRLREELQPRNVRCFTFFDLVLDYVVLDAFDDLASPPAAIVAVMNNRWLTSNFKESALNTAIWSVMRAKRKSLLYADGFKAHYYALAEHLIPVLAWGLLGPDRQLGDLCHFLKDHVAAYVRDIFSEEKVRFGSVEEVSEDLHALTRSHLRSISEWMGAACKNS